MIFLSHLQYDNLTDKINNKVLMKHKYLSSYLFFLFLFLTLNVAIDMNFENKQQKIMV